MSRIYNCKTFDDICQCPGCVMRIYDIIDELTYSIIGNMIIHRVKFNYAEMIAMRRLLKRDMRNTRKNLVYEIQKSHGNTDKIKALRRRVVSLNYERLIPVFKDHDNIVNLIVGKNPHNVPEYIAEMFKRGDHRLDFCRVYKNVYKDLGYQLMRYDIFEDISKKDIVDEVPDKVCVIVKDTWDGQISKFHQKCLDNHKDVIISNSYKITNKGKIPRWQYDFLLNLGERYVYSPQNFAYLTEFTQMSDEELEYNDDVLYDDEEGDIYIQPLSDIFNFFGVENFYPDIDFIGEFLTLADIFYHVSNGNPVTPYFGLGNKPTHSFLGYYPDDLSRVREKPPKGVKLEDAGSSRPHGGDKMVIFSNGVNRIYYEGISSPKAAWSLAMHTIRSETTPYDNVIKQKNVKTITSGKK